MKRLEVFWDAPEWTTCSAIQSPALYAPVEQSFVYLLSVASPGLLSPDPHPPKRHNGIFGI